ncbi:DUF2235 domain-containing protein [Caulobacter soli]|uniref:DUF2235 domain-containing protein n=1 Tax=Caulobacter soli TaxID=2708539 RepID=UPI0013EBD860|nr:DUF2235 domain-containing protein [Caulobacter soli]
MVKLAVFCDGTWNGLRMPNLTNVARLARSVKQTDDDGQAQIVFYDEGVGVKSGVSRTTDWLESVLGGAFGWGLDRKIEQAYRFIVLNYRPIEDDIYIFGFSRGAYTARSLCGLIRKCGILRPECMARIPEAVKLYRNRNFHPAGPECQEFRRLYAHENEAVGDEDLTEQERLVPRPSQDKLVNIRYLGLWDTVGSMGVPDRFLLLSFFNRRYRFHDTRASALIESLRHAIAADEDRRTFGATPFSNIRELNVDAAEKAAKARTAEASKTFKLFKSKRAFDADVATEGSWVAEQDKRPYQQKWFPGDHGAVGGGNPQFGLSSAALLWVAQGAEVAGLALDHRPTSDLTAAEAQRLSTADWRVGATPGTTRSPWACDLLGLIGGYRARAFTISHEEVHDSARERWRRIRSYRPKVFEPFTGRVVIPPHRKVAWVLGPLMRLLIAIGAVVAILVALYLVALLTRDLLCLVPWSRAQEAADALTALGESIGKLIEPCCKPARP